MFWQFTLKSIEELNMVTNQDLLVEMFLIRLIYLKQIPKLDDLLSVTSSIIQLKRASLIFNQQIFNQNKQLLCSVIVTVACVNLTLLKPCAIPETILGALKGVS